MIIDKRVRRALLTVALVSSLLYTVPLTNPSAASAAPSTTTPDAVKGSDAAKAQNAAKDQDAEHVTLITGDRLIVLAGGEVAIEPNAARKDIQFTTFTSQGQKYVIPSDALPLVTAGDLDDQLFNVTGLLTSGFKDGTLPLLVTYTDGKKSGTRGLLSTGRVEITRDLSIVDSVAASAKESSLGALWNTLTTSVDAGRRLKSGVDKVALDGMASVTLDQSVPQVGAPAAHKAGYDGTGVTVAVLDTGIDTNHPDLAGKVIAERNFTWEPDASDQAGHGTHVASTIAGSGAASQGRNRGVAPGAKLINGKVCTFAGSCPESGIVEAMKWAVDQGANVVNISIGYRDTPAVDLMEQTVNELTAQSGTLFVIAAGNKPKTPDLASPGTADGALTVGAVDGSENLATFSHRGPRFYDGALKPDLTAPGVAINAAKAGTQDYIEYNGTSMAAPHVAGAAAILRQRRPNWSATQLKSALIGSTVPNASLSSYEQGSGRLDVARAYQQTIVAEPANVSLGRQEYPHGDDPVLTRTVTYRNYGTSPMTLSLGLSTRGPSGAAAPAGMFALNATSVTVPANGQASVTLSTDTRVDTPDGYYTGAITATGGSVGVRTAFAVDRGIEAYDLTLNHIDRQGEEAVAYSCLVQTVDASRYWAFDVWPRNGNPGPFTVPRLPKGSYLVTSVMSGNGPQGSETSVLTVPRLEMTQNRAVTMDARQAQPVSVTVSDNPRATRYATEVSVQMTGHGESASLQHRNAATVTYTAQLGEQNVWGFVSGINTIMTEPGTNGDSHNSPRVYHLAWFTEQRLPTGFTRNVSAADLATVDVTLAGHIPGSGAVKTAFPHPGGNLIGAHLEPPYGALGVSFDLPFRRTELYNTDGGVRWHSVMAEYSTPGAWTNLLVSPPTHYTSNTTTRQTWNRPVYGPTFAAAVYPENWVVRRGDTITANLPLTGDGDGHAGIPATESVTGTLLLKRNGTVLGETPYPSADGVPKFTVPAGYAQYRLEASVERAAPSTLSTKVNAAWSFTSDTVDPNTYLRLPLWAVTFSPNTDSQGTAPAGRSFQIPLRAQAQADAATSGLRTLTVDYSFDDGKTWQNAVVTRAADGTGTATVIHPNATGFVTLRARAEDQAGNAVEQTVTRAYRIAPA